MSKTCRWVIAFLLVTSVVCFAQTTVTTSGGSANSIPKFSGASTIVSSSINQDASGNIGVGTATPAAKFDVIGQVRSTITDPSIGGAMVIANPAKTTAGTASSWYIYNMSGGYGNSLQFWAYDNIGCTTGGLCTARLILQDNGNVGIGTNPGARLDVQGGPTRFGASGSPQRVQLGGAELVYFNADQPTVTSGQIIGGMGFYGYGVSHGQFDYRAGKGFELLDVSADAPSITHAATTYAPLYLSSVRFPDGTSQSTAWTGALCGGDYAESVDISDTRTHYEPGDVLVLDIDNPGKVLKSVEPYSTVVSGIYSTKPGLVGRRQLTAKTDSEVPMAVVGIVPTKVTTENGAIHVGDLLVSSSLAGYAMKGTDRSRMLGAVIGKAMGNLGSGTGVIEVLVSLQ